MSTRRTFLKHAAQLGAAIALNDHVCRSDESEGVEVNDVQSQLNATRVASVLKPQSLDDLQAALRDARRRERGVSLAG